MNPYNNNNQRSYTHQNFKAPPAYQQQHFYPSRSNSVPHMNNNNNNFQQPIINSGFTEPYDPTTTLGFNDVCNKYQISERPYRADLKKLDKYDIVFVLDDSGSMLNKITVDGKIMTRWELGQYYLNIIAELAITLDQDGIDIIPLNRDPMYNVTDLQSINSLFEVPPTKWNSTPLCKAVKKAYKRREKGKPMLLIILTDGQPNKGIKKFKKLLVKRPHKKIPIGIIACSDRSKDIGYLNEIDEKVKKVDVLEDYTKERKQVLGVQGSTFSYSFGEHVARALLGPVFQKYDDLDEKKLKN